MNKDRLLKTVLAKLHERIEPPELQLSEILRRATEVPGAMESHSDTEKNQWGRQAGAQKETIEAMRRERVAIEALLLVAVSDEVVIKKHQ